MAVKYWRRPDSLSRRGLIRPKPGSEIHPVPSATSHLSVTISHSSAMRRGLYSAPTGRRPAQV